MSKNPGNTGHRYTMPHILSVEAQDGRVLVHIDCGHDYTIQPDEYWPLEKALADGQKRVGMRVRCNQCKKGTS